MARKQRLIVAAVAGTALVLLVGWMWYRMHDPRLALEIPLQGVRAQVFHFSPDGRTLAVVTVGDPWYEPGHGTRIYRVSDGALLRELEGGGLECAWNWDGSLLAIARNSWPDIEIWDTRMWTLKNRLALFDPAKERPKSDAPIWLQCTGLCFDRLGNLYVIEWSDRSEAHPNAFPYDIPRATIWWNAGNDRTELKTEKGCSELCISAATLGDRTRLACSYEKCPVEILAIGRIPDGRGMSRREYRVPEIAMSRRERYEWSYASVSLAPDGRFLVALDRDRVFFFELLDGRAKLIDSRAEKSGILPFDPDISRDGRFAAYSAQDRTTVVRIPSAETVLSIEEGPTAVSLSSDGRLLATGRRSIRLYHVPQAEPSPQDGR